MKEIHNERTKQIHKYGNHETQTNELMTEIKKYVTKGRTN